MTTETGVVPVFILATDAARILGASSDTVRPLEREGRLPARRTPAASDCSSGRPRRDCPTSDEAGAKAGHQGSTMASGGEGLTAALEGHSSERRKTRCPAAGQRGAGRTPMRNGAALTMSMLARVFGDRQGAGTGRP